MQYILFENNNAMLQLVFFFLPSFDHCFFLLLVLEKASKFVTLAKRAAVFRGQKVSIVTKFFFNTAKHAINWVRGHRGQKLTKKQILDPALWRQ